MQIQRVIKGDADRTLLHAEHANALIDAVNSLLNMRVSTARATVHGGKLDVSPGGSVLSIRFPTSDAIAAATSERYSFQLVDVSDSNGFKVLVVDGEINGELPSGQGNDDYVLPINSDGVEIYAIVTYDTDSFEITSRSIGIGQSTPDSNFGTLYVRIGYVNFITTFTPTGIIVNVGTTAVTGIAPHNTQCGDINFAFEFGGKNGKPAVKCGSYGDYIEIPLS